MKTKRSKAGRKKFSAGKSLGPDKSLEENINLAAMGECAVNPQLREAFQIVALWETIHSRPKNVPKHALAAPVNRDMLRKRTRSHEARLLRLLQESLARITPELRRAVFSAVKRLDSKPFWAIATAIDVAKQINESGAFQQVHVRAALVALELYGLKVPASLVAFNEWGVLPRFDIGVPASLLVVFNEFVEEYEKGFGPVSRDFLRKSCTQLGLSFKPDKQGRKPKNSVISS